jgi:hypothetical protein
MPSLNDTLTVGLVLILLFGAVSLYLYTRIQQCEQKLNLVESILLDIKMSAELRDYPDIPFSSFPQMPGPVAVQQQRSPTPPTPSSPHENRKGVAAFDDREAAEDLFVGGGSGPVAVEEFLPETLPSIDETRVQIHEVSVAAAAPVAAPAPAPTVASSRVSVGANYESMTLTELKALAQQRNITGAKSMKRNQILEALRTSDRATDAGSLLPLAQQQAVEVPASDVEGFAPLEGTTLTGIAHIESST